jgi:hypothetical protein
LKAVAEHHVDNIHVSFICRPWVAPAVKPKSEGLSKAENRVFTPKEVKDRDFATKVDEFWEKFRDFNIDRLPIQVKILSIWSALHRRYNGRICVIGHRSGFIEAAGLIGIPVFYLNNERNNIGINLELSKRQKEELDKLEEKKRKAEKAKLKELQRQKLLWRASVVGCPENDRLRELADVVNTLIPVEALEENARMVKGKNGVAQKVYLVADELAKELRAAIFIYMCCRVKPGLAAWTFRVEMMHQEAEAGVEEAPAQKWLRKRWLFATGQDTQEDKLPTETGLRHESTETQLKLSVKLAIGYYVAHVKNEDGKITLEDNFGGN